MVIIAHWITFHNSACPQRSYLHSWVYLLSSSSVEPFRRLSTIATYALIEYAMLTRTWNLEWILIIQTTFAFDKKGYEKK